MTDPQPGPDRRRESALGVLNVENRGLYTLVICILGLVLVVGVVGWLILAALDKSVPDGLGVVIGTVAGGLVGLISDKGSGDG